MAQTPLDRKCTSAIFARMGDTFAISGLREKRSSVAREIMETRRHLDRLQADIFHIDAVLRLYGLAPEEIPTKGRAGIRSAYFDRNEISRRCRDMLREKGTIRAEDVTVRAMREKSMDPSADKKLRRDFTRRILVTLHDLRKAGAVMKLGHGRGVFWRLADDVPNFHDIEASQKG
jgi:hypothetical protein